MWIHGYTQELILDRIVPCNLPVKQLTVSALVCIAWQVLIST